MKCNSLVKTINVRKPGVVRRSAFILSFPARVMMTIFAENLTDMKHLKQEFDKLTIKEVIMYSLAVVTMIAGLTLLFLGVLLEPRGQIHSSVLYAFGLICVFVSTLLGISMKYQAELDRYKAEINKLIGGLMPCQAPDGEQEQQ